MCERDGSWLCSRCSPRLLPAAGVEIIDAIAIFRGHCLGDIAGHGNRAGDIAGPRRGPVVSAQVGGAEQRRDGIAQKARGPLSSKLTRRFTKHWPSSTSSSSRSIARSSWWRRLSRRRWCTSWRRRWPDLNLKSRRTAAIEETGSGVIIRSNRGPGLYVLTNHHVVDGAKVASIRVFLHDGRSILPVKVWNDAQADVAVLQARPR